MTAIEPPSSIPTRTVAADFAPRLPYRPGLRPRLWAFGCLLVFACCAKGQSSAIIPGTPQWALAWSDEFNAPNGTIPDPAKWSYDLGGSGFGNNELETYTSRPVNAQQANGKLIITARKEDFTGLDGKLRHYTSARIRTQGAFAEAYGRFEASIKLPLGKGIWPAFWLLGSDIHTVGWPSCGEIDIVENIGGPTTSHSTLHGPGYSGGMALTTKFDLPAGERVDTAFHLYAVEWASNDIKFFLDDRLVVERTLADLPAGAKWVFDHPFFIIVNLAVGGDWPGNPDATTTFPQQMLVDYVRVYRRATRLSEPGR